MDEHVSSQQKGDYPRAQDNGEQNAAHSFQGRNEIGVESRGWNAEACDELDKLRHIRQMGPSALPELPPPKEPYCQQEGRLQKGGYFDEPGIKRFQLADH